MQNTTALDDSLPQSPSATCVVPSKDAFPGPRCFEIFLDSTTAHKRSWVYSTMLNKVFINIYKCLPVLLRVNDNISGLRVRAVPVYSQDDSISEPVQRCTIHALNDDVLRKAHSEDQRTCNCANYHLVGHVMRSNHPLAIYEYDADSGRHSVLVPLESPQPGSDIITVKYHFSCKNSCPEGMSRRPIDVVFTLETEQGQIIGRQVLPVKICMCPLKSKEKEEARTVTMNRSNSNLCGPGKKRMSSSGEKEETNAVPINHNNSSLCAPSERRKSSSEQPNCIKKIKTENQ